MQNQVLEKQLLELTKTLTSMTNNNMRSSDGLSKSDNFSSRQSYKPKSSLKSDLFGIPNNMKVSHRKK